MDENKNTGSANFSNFNTRGSNRDINNNGGNNASEPSYNNAQDMPHFDNTSNSGNGIASNLGEKALNSFLNKKNGEDSLGASFENGAKEAGKMAITAAKTGSKVASGNYVGAAVEVLKNDKFRNIVIAIFLIPIFLIMFMIDSVPSPIEAPVENYNASVRVAKAVKNKDTKALKQAGLTGISDELPEDAKKLYDTLSNNNLTDSFYNAAKSVSIITSKQGILKKLIAGDNVDETVEELQPYLTEVSNWSNASDKGNAADIVNYYYETANSKLEESYAKVVPLKDALYDKYQTSIEFENGVAKNRNTSRHIWGLRNLLDAAGINVETNLNSANEDDLYSSDVELNSVFDIVAEKMLDVAIKCNLIDIYSLNILHYSIEDLKSEDNNYSQAPFFLKETAKKLTNAIGLIAQQRGLKLEDTIDKDFAVKVKNNKNYIVSKIVNNSVSSSYPASEAAKLMCLYAVQTDNALTVNTFNDFLTWLGYGDNVTYKQEDAEKYKDWDVIPEKPVGLLMAQSDYEELMNILTEYRYNFSTVSITSAMAEIVYLDPEISERTWGEEICIGEDEEGNPQYESKWYKEYTYNIKTKSVDDMVKDIVKFDEAVEKDDDGNPNRLKLTTYKEAWYKEMCEYCMSYLGISGGLSGGYGSGSSVVAIAYAEWQAGVAETTGNNDVKYNDWYYGHHVSGSNYPWCNVFVSWCANEAGIGTDIIPKEAGTYGTYTFYANKELIHHTGDGYKPKPGDLVLRTPGEHGHIEIIYEYDDATGKVTTIGGNTSNNVNGEGQVEREGDCVGMHIRDLTYWTYVCEVPYPFASGEGLIPISGPVEDRYNSKYSDISQIPQTITKEFSISSCINWVSKYANISCSQQELARQINGKVTGKYSSAIGTEVASIGNAALVATTKTFGADGDYLYVHFTDGTGMLCVKWDTKSMDAIYGPADPANKWGHWVDYERGKENATTISILEMGGMGPNGIQKKCDWIMNLGKYVDNPGLAQQSDAEVSKFISEKFNSSKNNNKTDKNKADENKQNNETQ